MMTMPGINGLSRLTRSSRLGHNSFQECQSSLLPKQQFRAVTTAQEITKSPPLRFMHLCLNLATERGSGHDDPVAEASRSSTTIAGVFQPSV